MTTSALRLNDPLLPPHPGGLGTGATLALAAHTLLVTALAFSVQWRASTPEVFSAELWSAVPQRAAPRIEEAPAAPAPRPADPPAAVVPPPDAQIAIERERRDKLQQERLQREQEQRSAKARAETERREKERREKAEQRVAEARAQQELERRREENLKRMLGQAGTGPATSTGTAAADAAPSRSYAGRLVAAIKPNIVFTDRIAGNPAAEVEVRLAAGGSVLSRRLLKTSGMKDWDEAVLRAIDRTGVLPRDVDGRVPPVLVIAFRPND